jgi:20S proteasome alpha/beta subunit
MFMRTKDMNILWILSMSMSMFFQIKKLGKSQKYQGNYVGVATDGCSVMISEKKRSSERNSIGSYKYN